MGREQNWLWQTLCFISDGSEWNWRGNGELGSVQYMEYSRQNCNMDKLFPFLSLQWCSDKDINHTVEERYFGTAELLLSPGELFGNEPFY